MKNFKYFILIGILGFLGASIARGESINISDGVIEGGECTTTATISFDKTVTYATPLPATLGPLTRDPNSNLSPGSNSYTIKYYITDGNGPATLNVNIQAGTVCFNGTNLQACGISNARNKAFSNSKTIQCPAGSTTITTQSSNNAQPGAGGTTCSPPNCNPDAGEQCLEGKCICVPTAGRCCGVNLNTNVPFIGNCIQLLSAEEKQILQRAGLLNDVNTTTVTDQEAFPVLMMGLTKILVTIILLASFIAIIIAGVMIAASGSSDSASKGMKLIGSVVAALALLGASGVILRLINPNFFG